MGSFNEGFSFRRYDRLSLTQERIQFNLHSMLFYAQHFVQDEGFGHLGKARHDVSDFRMRIGRIGEWHGEWLHCCRCGSLVYLVAVAYFHTQIIAHKLPSLSPKNITL
jgi:hypothetical protein